MAFSGAGTASVATAGPETTSPAMRVAVADRVGQRHGAAHAVTDEERPAADARDEQAEVLDELVEPADHRASAVGAAVAAMVERVHDVALAGEALGDVPIAAAVLGRAVDEHHAAARLGLRLPRLPVQAHAVGRAEPSVTVRHAGTSASS